MARRLVKPTAIRIAVTQSLAGDFTIRGIELPSVEFVTMQCPRKGQTKRKTVRGRYVRIIPRVGATEEQVQELVHWCEADGAKGVKVLAIPREDVLTADKVHEVTEALNDLTGDRYGVVTGVVTELVEQSTVAEKLKPELLRYCQAVLEESNDASDDD